MGGDAKFIALSHHLVGCCLYHQLRNEEADQEFQTALACAAYCKDKLCESRTTRRVATVRMRQGRLDEAEELLKHCLEIEISHQSKRDQARSLRHLGRLEMIKQPSDMDAAKSCLDRSMAIMEEIMSLRGTGAVQLNQATCARLRGDYEEGLELAGLSLETAEKLGAPYAKGLCLIERAALHDCLSHSDEAASDRRLAAAILGDLHLAGEVPI
ncbi:MAG: tetratricopeptide repeat protein [Armatimonadota bacterium]